MTKINIPFDCGNAPKKLFLKEFYEAIINGNVSFITNTVSDKIYWEIVGEKNISGKEQFLENIVQHKLWNAKELTIDNIITHGSEATMNGLMVTEKDIKYSFCDIFKFNSAGSTIINSIKTYQIKI